MLNYWASIINGKQNKISYLLYKIMLKDTNTGLYQHKWITCIKNILTSVGKYNIWMSQTVNCTQSFKRYMYIAGILKGKELQNWHGNLENSSKGLTCRSFKHDLHFEPYLKPLSEPNYLPILKFISSNHKLPVDTGRWENIAHAERFCTLCQTNKLGGGGG